MLRMGNGPSTNQIFQVEYCYPAIGAHDNDGEVVLPTQWENLPSLCLPDGVHNVDSGEFYIHIFLSGVMKHYSDIVSFILPSVENPQKSLYGIACYK